MLEYLVIAGQEAWALAREGEWRASLASSICLREPSM